MTAVDAYGELRIWPDGDFSYEVDIRNTDPTKTCHVNASFVLFDKGRALIGTFGMSPQDKLSVHPWGQHSVDLLGKIPAKDLAKTKSVALAFRLANQKPDIDRLRAIASGGDQLALGPEHSY